MYLSIYDLLDHVMDFGTGRLADMICRVQLLLFLTYILVCIFNKGQLHAFLISIKTLIA